MRGHENGIRFLHNNMLTFLQGAKNLPDTTSNCARLATFSRKQCKCELAELLKQTICQTLQPTDSRICAGPRKKMIVPRITSNATIGEKGPPNYHTKQIAMCLFCD